mgnify:CR=1 FL=1
MASIARKQKRMNYRDAGLLKTKNTYSRFSTQGIAWYSKMAEEGKLDPVIGRSKEIERVIQILGRRTKNNPILIVISVVKRIKKVYKVFTAFGNTSKNGRA